MAKILVVDDQPANREVLVALLQYGGHQILEAGDGAEALEIASENRPDLVITDILMPAMDGYELVKRLRGNRSIAGTPVIYYTAHYLEQEALALAEKSGVAHVLPKPFEPEQVWSVVQAALGLERAPAPPPPAEQFDREHLGLVTNKLSQKASELRLANLRFRALIELGQQLNSELDPAALVRSYTRAAREIVGAERAMVRLTGQDPPGVFTSGFQDGETARLLDAFRRPGLLRDVESGSEARMVRSLDGEPLESGAPGVAIHSLLAAPIASPGRRYGWLYAFNKLGKPEFTELEGQLAQMLAGHLAVGYEKARLYEEAGRRAAALEREVAERARAEKALRERESRYRMLMEQASDGIVIFDAAGELTEANPAFCAMLGASREELLGKKIAAFFPAEDAPFELGAAGDQGGERRARKERRLARRDGKLVVGQIGASILADGCMQLIVRDISDSRALEEQLRQAQKMEAIGRLAGGVAHDFNNLLTAIMGYGEVALATLPADTELHSNIKEILIIADRAAVLTSQLLACSRRQVMRPKVLNLNSVVANMTKLCARVLGEQIELIINLAENLRPVKADPGMIEQVILNLAVNASDAMPAGGKLVISTGNIDIDEDYLRTHLGFQPGPYITLTVSDTGCGIAADVLPRIFEPFFTTKEAGKGTGLGLSIVYGIVTQSGGYIGAYSEPNFGTTFRIYLPACSEALTAKGKVERGQPLPKGTETVLVVEDDPIVRQVELSVLRSAGYTVLEAENGEEALRVAGACDRRIDLLLTDIIMPGMNGKDLADIMRKRHEGVKVLFCSGYAEDVIVHHGILDAGIAFLQKPFTPRALTTKLREILNGN